MLKSFLALMSFQRSEFTATYKRIAIFGAKRILRNLATTLLFLFCPYCSLKVIPVRLVGD